MYIGSIKNGKYHGMGKLIYGPGEFRQGYFHNGVFRKGVWMNNSNFKLGEFENDLLHGIECVMYTNGYIFKGMFQMGSPILLEFQSSFDQSITIQCLGYKGTITKSYALTRDQTESGKEIVEGVIIVDMEPLCVFTQIVLATCIYSGKYEQYGYVKDLDNHLLRIKEVEFKGGNRVSYKNTYIQSIREGSIMHLYDYEYQILPHLFNECTKKVFLPNSNTTIDYVVQSTQSRYVSNSPLSTWGTRELIVWILVMFPHFDATIPRNVDFYKITGDQLLHMSDRQCESLCPSYTTIQRDVFLKQLSVSITRQRQCHVENVLRGTSLDHSPIDFYLELLISFPRYNEIIRFVKQYRIDKNVFLLLDESQLCTCFGTIPIFQIKHHFVKA
jgi:hypothetical protein